MKFIPSTIAMMMCMLGTSDAFVSPQIQTNIIHPTTINPMKHSSSLSSSRNKKTKLFMGLDLVTYLRCEWISAALCTNQTPVSADVCLQLGTEDGRAITFIPRTIRKFITASADSADSGEITVAAQRQLKQQMERRGTNVELVFANQKCDDLKEVDDESVDIVISLCACQRMIENGQDWKRSVQETSRVLKPGGRLLFVEQTELGPGKSQKYLDYIQNLGVKAKAPTEFDDSDEPLSEDEIDEVYPVFQEIGSDDVDLVLVPHVAGVAIKSIDAGLTRKQREQKRKKEEDAKYAELSISAFERGSKKKRKKKKANAEDEDA